MPKLKQRRGLKKNQESQQQKQKYQSSNHLLFDPHQSDFHDHHHQKIQQTQLGKMNNLIEPQNVFHDSNYLKIQQSSTQQMNDQIQNQRLIGQNSLWIQIMKLLIFILLIHSPINALQTQTSKIENNNIIVDQLKDFQEIKKDIQDVSGRQKSLSSNAISIIQNHPITTHYGPFFINYGNRGFNQLQTKQLAILDKQVILGQNNYILEIGVLSQTNSLNCFGITIKVIIPQSEQVNMFSLIIEKHPIITLQGPLFYEQQKQRFQPTLNQIAVLDQEAIIDPYNFEIGIKNQYTQKYNEVYINGISYTIQIQRPKSQQWQYETYTNRERLKNILDQDAQQIQTPQCNSNHQQAEHNTNNGQYNHHQEAVEIKFISQGEIN